MLMWLVGLLYGLTRRSVMRGLLLFPAEVFSHKKLKRLTADLSRAQPRESVASAQNRKDRVFLRKNL